MRLVFKQTILDRIHEALADARIAGREVEKIILTRTEMGALGDLPMSPVPDDPHAQHYPEMRDGETYIDGVLVVEESTATLMTSFARVD